MKTKPFSIKLWAVVWNKEGTIEYMPEIFYSRKSARAFQKDSNPHGRVIQAVIKEIKRK